MEQSLADEPLDLGAFRDRWTSPERLSFTVLGGTRSLQSLAEDVKEGLALSPRQLPAAHFYDDEGSRLFERITQLPEYYLTRAETEILNNWADEIIQSVPAVGCLIEFGSGSAKKTRLLIDAVVAERADAIYAPIDISKQYLLGVANALLSEYPSLRVRAIVAEYNEATRAIPNIPMPRLFMFLGSSIGNMRPSEALSFLESVRGVTNSADRLLLGVDLVKDVAVLEAAYNDSEGVTAEFNKNVLRRINLELDADFDLDAFEHVALYDQTESRIEMRLRSTQDQTVEIGALGMVVRFIEGESIVTEHSHKYTESGLATLAMRSGFSIHRFWRDCESRFALVLLEPEGA